MGRKLVACTLLIIGVLLGIGAASEGRPGAGLLFPVPFAAVAGLLWWVGSATDSVEQSRRRRIWRSAATVAIGCGTVAAGVATLTEARSDGAILIAVGVAIVAGGAGWWAATRRAELEPGPVEGMIELGDGRAEPGRLVAFPRLRRIAMVVLSALFAAGGVPLGLMMRADGEPYWLVSSAAMSLLGLLGLAFSTRGLSSAAYLAVSPTGLTVRYQGEHYTVPWMAVDRAGIYEFTLRGHRQRYVGIRFDLDAAVGKTHDHVVLDLLRSVDRRGWTVVYPPAVLDIDADRVVTWVNDAKRRHAPT